MIEILLTIIGTITLGISSWALFLLVEMKGKMAETEIWQRQHDKQDDERHENNDQEHRDLWSAIKKR